MSTNLAIYGDKILGYGGEFLCADIDSSQASFYSKRRSISRQFMDTGKRRLNPIIKCQMRALIQTVRTVWIMVYDQMTQMSCHTRRKNKVGVTM